MSLSGPAAVGVSVAPRRGHEVRTPVLWVLASGLALGATWRLALPAARAASDSGETDVAGDASFFLLAAAAGLITALVLLRRPGVRPALRLGVVLIAALVASALAVGVSRLVGGPPLTAWGGLVVWSLSTALWVSATIIFKLLFRSP